MAGLWEQQLASSSQHSKVSSACEHFYSLSVISCTSPSLRMVIYLLPSLCLKHLRQNKDGERGLGEGYPASLWLLAVERCMCCGLYFWQAFRYRGFLLAHPHAVRSGLWSQALHFPRSRKPPGNFSGNLGKCLRLPQLQATVQYPHGVAHSRICHVWVRPDDVVRRSFWICR